MPLKTMYKRCRSSVFPSGYKSNGGPQWVSVLDLAMKLLLFTFLCTLGLCAVVSPSTEDALELEANGSIATSSSDQNEIVNKHNTLRRNVKPTASNMLKMSWNSEAAANAQRWANTCSMNHSTSSQRIISTSGCGENLYMASNKNSWSDAIQSWYDEVNDWRYGVGSVNGKEVGHFTQVVWYRSNQIGCAIAYCPNSDTKYFYVCQYCPPGNYQLTHPYKSGPSCGDCPNACDNKLCTNPCLFTDKYSNCPDLKQQWGCKNPSVKSWCPATCKCDSQIS
ncbi:cysteine-rich venom protein TEL1-like [Corythoichthys intestinalis]|uniref:cysteine-rich venom protein TEL1-like n=1 Tax=Corythoichthys intestinalis TaxID=161448 RepID=UPI0025A6013A|nr:cysteine-rich venom protein TEL1-like [Corythoichthys intestinalis]XP_061806752.1 cysteine-rich venom protein TEL1-like [Nerophis lumbriciformis]